MLELIASSALVAQTGLGGPADIWASILRDFSNIGEPGALAAFVQVLMIDLVLAGDNAIVVGALAAGLPPDQRRKVILIGVLAALFLRVGFALVVTQLLQIVGLILAGGLLLLWVAWKMWREMRHGGESSPGSDEILGDERSGLRSAKNSPSAPNLAVACGSSVTAKPEVSRCAARISTVKRSQPGSRNSPTRHPGRHRA